MKMSVWSIYVFLFLVNLNRDYGGVILWLVILFNYLMVCGIIFCKFVIVFC